MNDWQLQQEVMWEEFGKHFMTEKAYRVNKLIDEIPGVCAQGRDGIRKLVQEITELTLITDKPKITYKIGDQFRAPNGNEYILTAAPEKLGRPKVVAVNLATGSRRSSAAVPVNTTRAITETELRSIFSISLQASLPIRIKESKRI